MENIRQIHNGDIVLMHDFQPADSDAIEPLIKFLLKDGFTPVSLKELVGKDNFYNSQLFIVKTVLSLTTKKHRNQ